MEKKLQRIPHEGAVAGVCTGLGEYFGIDKTWVRIAFILSVFFAGYGIGLLGPIVYVVLWIVLPVKLISVPKNPFDVDYQTAEIPSDIPLSHEASGTHWPRKASKDRYVAGIAILAIGIFFLLHQLDIFYWSDFVRFWPVLIIVVGLSLLISAFNDKSTQPKHTAKSETTHIEADTATQPSDKKDNQESSNNQGYE